MSLLVAASLWSVPADEREREADRLALAGLRRWHWDASDGVLAAPGGFDAVTADRLTRRTGVPGEAHLMVADPLAHVDAWADVCETVVVHVEAQGWDVAVERVLGRGRRAGVAVSPDTPLSALDGLPFDVAVLVMAITPGQAGSAFRPATLVRLDALTGRRALGVDGGVTLDHARACAAHGATWVVSGSALCASPDPRAWLAAASRSSGTSGATVS